MWTWRSPKKTFLSSLYAGLAFSLLLRSAPSEKSFVFLRESRKENHVALWFKASLGVQEELVEQDPDRFFAPPYLGPAGWVGMRLDIDLDWEEVTEAMEQAWRLVAPKKAIKEFEDATY